MAVSLLTMRGLGPLRDVTHDSVIISAHVVELGLTLILNTSCVIAPMATMSRPIRVLYRIGDLFQMTYIKVS